MFSLRFGGRGAAKEETGMTALDNLKLLGALGGAFVAGMTLTHQYLVPSYLAEANFRIARLEESVKGSDNERLTKQLAEAKAQLARSETLLAETQKRLQDMAYAPLFEKGHILPVGMRQIRPGDLLSRVAEVYPASAIEQSKDTEWYIVRNQHKTFTRVALYYSEGTIYQIAFFTEPRSGPTIDFLKDRLRDMLGEPTDGLVGSQKAYFWLGQDNLQGRLSETNGGGVAYSVRLAPTAPPTSSNKPKVRAQGQ
jgi:hypothetical protein